MWLIVVIWFAQDTTLSKIEPRGYYDYQRQCEEVAGYIETHMTSTEKFRVVCVSVPR